MITDEMITNNLHHNPFDIDVQNMLHIPCEKNFIKNKSAKRQISSSC